ncbi:spore coat protein [Shouchella clausii]
MHPLIERLTGLNTLTDQIIAADMLADAKNAVRTYAMALTESASPDIRTLLARQLEEAIDTHERLFQYMLSKGFYHAYNIEEQLRQDVSNIQTVLTLPS